MKMLKHTPKDKTLTCQKCGGIGSVADEQNTSAYIPVQCPECDGTGCAKLVSRMR